MAYKIYRNIKIAGVKTEKVTPNLRPYDISGDTFRRDSYHVQMLEFSNYEHVSFSDPMIYIVPIAAFRIWLLWKSLPYFDTRNDVGFIPAGFGAGALALAIFIFCGYSRESTEPGKALKELLAIK